MEEPQGAAGLMRANEKGRVEVHARFVSKVIAQCSLNQCFATITIIELDQIMYL